MHQTKKGYTMLIKFTVRNFKTFKDQATLNFVASNYDKESREEENVVNIEKYNLRLLKSAVVYGANASGKTKLFQALAFMKDFILSSSKDSQAGEAIKVDPFRLHTESLQDSSEFELVFLHNNEIYRYGFEANNEKIIAEWLYFKPKTKEIEIFYRDEQSFENIHDKHFKKGAMIAKENLVRENALFLSVASQFNDEFAKEVLSFFYDLKIISGLDEKAYGGFTIGEIAEGNKKRIINFIQNADFNIEDISLESIKDENDIPSDMPTKLKELISNDIKKGKKIISDISAHHNVYDENYNSSETTSFSMDNDESNGTQKFFYISGPVINALEHGYTLIVDELDSRLHPNLVGKIMALFNSKEFNPKNAQLVFNTHNTNLLSSKLLRRDQVWFTNKDRYGAATLYSLADIKNVRKVEAFEDNYIQGKYGAIPYLNDLNLSL